ncbi:helix-turn-helix domain-containing protein [Streptomyces sp. NPDC057596]|uniref:helix-turn-helix domain-containing protein n=1 Tax=Streptomyces sp. NPDC057596 TaxID=3346178 RepID=UPI0036B37FDB
MGTPEDAAKGNRRANEIGPTGKRVAENLAAVRKARGWSMPKLREEMAELGRHLPATGVIKTEAAERRVDVDDLVAFAVALNVSPLTLLLPGAWGDGDVWLTDRKRVQSRTAWLWGQGLAPAEDLPAAVEDEPVEAAQQRGRDYYDLEEEFRALALPAERRRAAEHPANREAQDLAEMVSRLVQVAGVSIDGDSASVKRALRAARLRLRKLEAELEQIEITAEELDDLSRPDR